MHMRKEKMTCLGRLLAGVKMIQMLVEIISLLQLLTLLLLPISEASLPKSLHEPKTDATQPTCR